MVEEIDVTSLADKYPEGVTLIDVRTESEYEDVHVPGSAHMPLADLPEFVDDLPEDQVIYVICATGARSRTACDFLLRQGYEAVNVAGGIQQWMQAGHEVQSGS